MSDNYTKYLKMQETEVSSNPCKKLPVVFLIDTSDSMRIIIDGKEHVRTSDEKVFKDGVSCYLVDGGYSRIDALKDSLRMFHKAMNEDKDAAVTCQTAYISFGDEAKIIEPFSLEARKDDIIDEIDAGDEHTYICEGIKTALELLDQQAQYLRNNRVQQFKPWLVIMTDGIATEDSEEVKKAKAELRRRQKNNQLIVYTVCLGDDEEVYENIRGYSIFKPIPYSVNADELKKFFAFITRSISTISKGKLNEPIKGYTDPDTISSDNLL